MSDKKIPETYRGNVFRTFRVFTEDPLAFLRNYASNEAGISSFRIFQYRMIHLSHPDFVKHLMEDNSGKYTQSRDRDHMKLLFGDGLLTTSGKHWQKQRAMIQPVFGRNRVEKLAEKILNQCRQLQPNTGKDIDLHQYSLGLVNHIMADIIFSDTREKVLDIGNRLMYLKEATLKRLSDFALPLWVPTPRNRKYKRDRAEVYAQIEALILKRKRSGMQQNDLLDSFLEARDKTSGATMSDRELTEELLGVYAAAHEPVAIALTYALYLVARHPEVRTRLLEELKSASDGAELTPASYPALRYTKNTVQETLRLYPPVWVSGKRALADDVIQGYRIKKNDNFIYSPVLLHSHPDFWEEPERFDPERFNGKVKHPFAYIPFSGGAKYCVGSHLALMILQLCLAEILLHFRIETDIEKVNINPFTTLKPVNRILGDVSRI